MAIQHFEQLEAQMVEQAKIRAEQAKVRVDQAKVRVQQTKTIMEEHANEKATMEERKQQTQS